MNKPLFTNKIVRPAYDVLGDRYTMLFSSEETGGAFSMFDFLVPKGRGTPPHMHSREDESFYVLSGEVEFMLGNERVLAKAGDVVFGPRGIPHNFTGVSDEPARMLCIASPGGFENFFAAIGRVVTDKNTPPRPPSNDDIARVMEIAPSFGIEMLVPKDN